MEASNNELRFFNKGELIKKMTFAGDAVQVKPKQVNVKYSFNDEESFNKAKEMAANLRKKYPHMKPARIARKVAECYHLNKVN